MLLQKQLKNYVLPIFGLLRACSDLINVKYVKNATPNYLIINDVYFLRRKIDFA